MSNQTETTNVDRALAWLAETAPSGDWDAVELPSVVYFTINGRPAFEVRPDAPNMVDAILAQIERLEDARNGAAHKDALDCERGLLPFSAE